MSYNQLTRPAQYVSRSLYSKLVAFPISCFVLTLLTDAAYWMTPSYLWATISVWLLTIGLIGAAFAIASGVIDLVRSRTVSGLSQPWPRLLGHFVAFALSIVNVLVHSRDGYTAVVPQGLMLSALVVLVLIVSAVSRRAERRRASVGGLA